MEIFFVLCKVLTHYTRKSGKSKDASCARCSLHISSINNAKCKSQGTLDRNVTEILQGPLKYGSSFMWVNLTLPWSWYHFVCRAGLHRRMQDFILLAYSSIFLCHWERIHMVMMPIINHVKYWGLVFTGICSVKIGQFSISYITNTVFFVSESWGGGGKFGVHKIFLDTPECWLAGCGRC